MLTFTSPRAASLMTVNPHSRDTSNDLTQPYLDETLEDPMPRVIGTQARKRRRTMEQTMGELYPSSLHQTHMGGPEETYELSQDMAEFAQEHELHSAPSQGPTNEQCLLWAEQEEKERTRVGPVTPPGYTKDLWLDYQDDDGDDAEPTWNWTIMRTEEYNAMYYSQPPPVKAWSERTPSPDRIEHEDSEESTPEPGSHRCWVAHAIRKRQRGKETSKIAHATPVPLQAPSHPPLDLPEVSGCAQSERFADIPRTPPLSPPFVTPTLKTPIHPWTDAQAAQGPSSLLFATNLSHSLTTR
jgi:hypothetical protein